MTFSSDLLRFRNKIISNQTEIHRRASELMRDSIKEGLALTGSPGQPVQESDLKNSWHLVYEEPMLSRISSHIIYAPVIENAGKRGSEGTLTLRSEVGGFHSVALTRAGLDKIVLQAIAEVY